jgi:hypothetical protein
VKRFLGISHTEWAELPWWVQRIYREGLQAEAPWIGRAVQLEEVDNALDLDTGLFSDDLDGPREEEISDAVDDEFNVVRSTVMTPLYIPASEE